MQQKLHDFIIIIFLWRKNIQHHYIGIVFTLTSPTIALQFLKHSLYWIWLKPLLQFLNYFLTLPVLTHSTSQVLVFLKWFSLSRFKTPSLSSSFFYAVLACRLFILLCSTCMPSFHSFMQYLHAVFSFFYAVIHAYINIDLHCPLFAPFLQCPHTQAQYLFINSEQYNIICI